MATHYDPTVIEQFADKLYEQADALVIVYSFFGFFGGLVPSLTGGVAYAMKDQDPSWFPVFAGVLACTALGTAFGILIGRERSFALRLQAQTALCQARIEWNTRRT